MIQNMYEDNDNYYVADNRHAVCNMSHLDEVLRYKPEGCRFDSRQVYWNS